MLFYGMENLTNNLAENIRLLRKQQGWTQTDLAEKLACTQEMVAYYEKGERKPPANKIPLLAAVFGITIDELYGVIPDKDNGKEKNPKLWKRFEQLELLPPTERRMIFKMIDGLITQKQP